jgi:hypothetical protein
MKGGAIKVMNCTTLGSALDYAEHLIVARRSFEFESLSNSDFRITEYAGPTRPRRVRCNYQRTGFSQDDYEQCRYEMGHEDTDHDPIHIRIPWLPA